jgi:hypothetical protein
MDNLTMLQKVFRPHAGLDPLEGYALVVYQQIGEGGAEFRGIIRPGERFQKRRFGLTSWLGLSESQNYFAIAINLASEMRHSFSDHFTMDDHVHEFDLVVDLAYCVADPESIATARNDDPLRQLCEKILLVIGGDLRRSEWVEVRYNFRMLEQAVVNRVMDSLQAFAAELGFAIKDIALRLRLPEAVLEVDIKREVTQRELEKFQNEQAAARARMEEAGKTEDEKRRREQEKLKQDEDNKAERRRQELENKSDLRLLEDQEHSYQQRRILRESTTEATSIALKEVGKNISTPAELLEGANAAYTLASKTLNGAPDGPADTRELWPNQAAPNLSLPAANDPNWIKLLTQAIADIEGWNYPFEQRRALNSAILHLVGEVLLDDRANDDALKHYADKIFTLSREFSPPLTLQQSRLLEKIRKYEQFREQVK